MGGGLSPAADRAGVMTAIRTGLRARDRCGGGDVPAVGGDRPAGSAELLRRQADQSHLRGGGGRRLRRPGAAVRAPSRPAHSGQSDRHRAEHAGGRQPRGRQPHRQYGAEGRPHHLAHPARHAAHASYQSDLRALRSQQAQLDRQPVQRGRGGVRLVHLQAQDRQGSVRAGADRRRPHRGRSGADAASLQRGARNQIQDRDRLQRHRRHRSGDRARRGRGDRRLVVVEPQEAEAGVDSRPQDHAAPAERAAERSRAPWRAQCARVRQDRIRPPGDRAVPHPEDGGATDHRAARRSGRAHRDPAQPQWRRSPRIRNSWPMPSGPAWKLRRPPARRSTRSWP